MKIFSLLVIQVLIDHNESVIYIKKKCRKKYWRLQDYLRNFCLLYLLNKFALLLLFETVVLLGYYFYYYSFAYWHYLLIFRKKNNV